MDKLRNFIKNHQQKLVITVGYLLVAGLGFGLGQISMPKFDLPEIRVEDAEASPLNYNSNPSSTQSIETTACDGQIKGSSSMIYHVPGGAFYNKTTSPTRCFDTEAQAQAAGFRKSSR